MLILPFLAPIPPPSHSFLFCRGAWLWASAGCTAGVALPARPPAAALLAGTTCSREWQTVAKACLYCKQRTTLRSCSCNAAKLSCITNTAQTPRSCAGHRHGAVLRETLPHGGTQWNSLACDTMCSLKYGLLQCYMCLQ